MCKTWYCIDQDIASDSGISDSWGGSSTDSDETRHLLLSTIDDSKYRMYTEEKVQYYEQTRKQESEVC